VLVWRIGYSGALTLGELGFGSTLGDGRWHAGCTGAQQVVYCAASRALCQLERRVHCNGAMPKNMALIRLEIPPKSVLTVVADLALPADWRQNESATQTIGMRWLASKSSLGLWVPSFVEPAENNLLLNPAHPDYARVSLVVEKNPFIFDPRLF
jgi:RES domain-containing protein